jgi:hypothetical protein
LALTLHYSGLSVGISQIESTFEGDKKMKSLKLQAAIFCLIMLTAVLVPINAKADSWNKATKLTFSEPVEVPGMVLEPGTYWFQLANSSSNRNIVQIWSADRMQLLKTILAIPDYRRQPTSDTVIKFDERPTGTPEAIQAWFYPGSQFGQEFVYPKARATELAQEVQRPVLEMRDEQAAAPAPALEQTPVKAVQPTGEEIEIAEVVATEEVLPTTASSLPTLALVGLLSIAAGLVLRCTLASNVA